MAGVLRWEDPPPKMARQVPTRPAADWWRIAAQLRDRPGEWAAVSETSAPTVAPAIRGGVYPAFAPGGQFDAVGRRVNGIYTVYARYVGMSTDHDGGTGAE